MPNPDAILKAIGRVKDQASFLRELLGGPDALNWPIPDKADAVSDLGYGWTADDLRAAGIEGKLKGDIYQLPLVTGQPWGIFVVEFADERVYRSVLRKVLRGLIPSRRQDSTLPSWKHENLLFLCVTKNYKNFTFAHFRGDNPATARLATFGWSHGDSHLRTLCERNLPALAWPDSPSDTPKWLKQWSGAFDIEAVTDIFFKEYQIVFELVEAKATAVPKGERRLYTQRLFNRLLFLYFIQKKGWLEFGGSKNYLRAMLTETIAKKEDFLNERLYWAFFYGLNTAQEDHAVHSATELTERRGTVPFLNGGLFDLEDKYDAMDAVKIPNASFDSILKLFERYNFTIAESTPLDVEVAVDPEMLGKVFEELVTGRSESGSFYTPRAVVSFMCREALKHYLTKVEPNAAAVAAFVDRGDPSELTNAEAVLDALRTVTVCDPACGSGAYLLGMMQELLRLRDILFAVHAKDHDSIYERKLEIITKNLHGVDLAPFAVNIAKLRLWLSLSVDYMGTKPKPLPNLDYKIECGDSLQSPDPTNTHGLEEQLLAKYGDQLAELKAEYLKASGKAKKGWSEKIEKVNAQIAKEIPVKEGIVEWRVAFAEVFKSGGFDVVLGNPPYVRKEEILVHLKPILKKNFGDAITGRSDLYCSFYARGLQLLRKNGMHVFVCSNSWLDAGYGAPLQEYILKKADVCAIYDSAIEKQFSTAEVNTIISVLRKKIGDNIDPIMAEFVQFKAPFISASVPAGSTVTRLSQPDLRKAGSANGVYIGNKWGGKYLRAPAIYKKVFSEFAAKFEPLSKLATLVGYIHDNSTGDDWPVKPLIWTIKSAKTIRMTPKSKGVEQIGVSTTGNSTTFAPILFARTYGTRHLVVLAESPVLGKEFYKIIPKDKANIDSIAIQLNSTLGMLQREILGMCGLGGGAVKFATDDVAQFAIVPKLNLAPHADVISRFFSREILDFDKDLQMEDRRMIDDILFDYLGLNSTDRAEIYRATFELINSRQTKSNTVSAS